MSFWKNLFGGSQDEEKRVAAQFKCTSCRIVPKTLREADVLVLAESFYFMRDYIRQHKLKGIYGGVSDHGEDDDSEVFAARVAETMLTAAEQILPTKKVMQSHAPR